MTDIEKSNIQASLVSIGFGKNYIQRAFKVYEKNYGNNYSLEVITEIIVRLQNKDKSKKALKKQFPKKKKVKKKANKDKLLQPFVAHISVLEANKLRVHDKIDHRDDVGRFVFATISEKAGTNLKIHYDGWSTKWDVWSDYKQEIHRFAKPGSISKRPAGRFKHLKKGDYIDINPVLRHIGWKCGEILRFDIKSGQIQIAYEANDEKNYNYWSHLDNEEEIAEFTKMTGDVQSDSDNSSDNENDQIIHLDDNHAINQDYHQMNIIDQSSDDNDVDYANNCVKNQNINDAMDPIYYINKKMQQNSIDDDEKDITEMTELMNDKGNDLDAINYQPNDMYYQLINMGFDEKYSITASKLYPNDIDKAIQTILNQNDINNPNINLDDDAINTDLDHQMNIIDGSANAKSKRASIDLDDNDNPKDNAINNDMIDTKGNSMMNDDVVNDHPNDNNELIEYDPMNSVVNPGSIDNIGEQPVNIKLNDMYYQLINMGFNETESANASKLYPNDIDKAIQNILNPNHNNINQNDINDTNFDKKEELTAKASMKKQFFIFLKDVNMENYFDKFLENNCCDMESIKYFDDDTLQNEIMIKSKILRKKLLAQRNKIQIEMNEFMNNYGISSLLLKRLAKYGIVTLSILCNEIKHKIDLKNKYLITNNNQMEFLWNIVQKYENIHHVEGF